MSKILLSVFLLGELVCGIVPHAHQRQHRNKFVSLHAKKGFGDKKETTPPKPKKKKQSTSPPVGSLTNTAGQVDPPENEEELNPFPEQNTDTSLGKMALERMRRERAEKRNEELRKVKEIKEVDALLRESPQAAVIPEKVAQRMGARMLPFVGIPLFGAMAMFVGFSYMATYRDMEFQPALVATSTIVLLAAGLLGITYSIMSASWDEDRDGSFLGTDEFSRNIDNIKTGLSRSRENAILREKIDEYSAEEIASLERKEAIKEKRRQSFSDRLEEDLD